MIFDLINYLGENIRIEAILDSNLQKSGSVFKGKYKVMNPFSFDFDSVDYIIITIFDKEVAKQIKKDLCKKYRNIGNKILIFKDFMREPEWPSEEQYFDKELIRLQDHECFVDAGVWDLGTSINFGKKCRCNRISDYHAFAFEPDNINYQRCEKIRMESKLDFISLVHAGLWSENGEQYFNGMGNGSSSVSDNGYSAHMVTLDEYPFDRKITFLKMDIEGAELQALKGGEVRIKNDKPKMAICIYHKPEDLTEIPIYIKSLVPEYKLYIRHYSNTNCETVLYAVI